ncbi:MAG: alpha/beta fold hydrolase, partial [bacterium]
MARVVLLHAFPFNGALWESVAADLRGRGHDVVTPDLRGFGSVPTGDAPPGIATMADDVVPLLGDGAIVAGCSMGGYVALQILRSRPDLVRGLVLVDTKATADGDAARERREAVARMAQGGEAWSAGMLDALVGPTSRERRPDVMSTVEASLAEAPGPGVAWAQRAMAARLDARDALAAFGGPVAVVWGEEDTVLSPREEQELMLAAQPRATLATVPECGHLSPLECPGQVADA